MLVWTATSVCATRLLPVPEVALQCQVSYSEGPSSSGDAHAATEAGSVVEPGSSQQAPGAGDVDKQASSK